MNVERLIRDELGRGGYDGLWCDDERCGCLLSVGLAPCGGDFRGCNPGYRVEVSADDDCGCEGCGKDHWHVEPRKNVVRIRTEGAESARVRESELLSAEKALSRGDKLSGRQILLLSVCVDSVIYRSRLDEGAKEERKG